MNANSTANLIGLILVPLIILLILAGIFLLVAYWKRTTLVDLKDIRGGIRELEGEYAALTTQASAYSPADPEPYGSLAQDLQSHIGQVQERVLQHRAVYGELHKRAEASKDWNLRTLPQAPILWYRIRKDITSVNKEQAAIRDEITRGSALIEGLHRRGLETAGEVREVQKNMIEANQALQQMRQWNMQGEAFEAANREKSLLLVSLSDIPENFLEPDEETILKGADKDSVVHVHQLIAENRQQVTSLHQRVKSWENQYREASNGMDQLRAGLEELITVVQSLPFELVIDPQRERMQQLQRTEKELETALATPQAENLSALNRDARRSSRLALDLHRQLNAAHQSWKSLMQGIPQLKEQLDTLQRAFQSLSSSPRVPLDWDISYAKLTALQKEIKALGSEKEPRTPEEVERDLGGLDLLSARYQEIAQAQFSTAEKQTVLASLLDSLDLEGTLVWLEEALNMSRQAKRYDPENWPKKVSANELAGELSSLAEQIAHLKTSILARPVRESYLDGFIEQTRALSVRIQTARASAETVQRRFDEVRALEDETVESLSAGRAALLQIQRIGRANEHLQASALPGIERALAELDAHAANLDNRAQGTLPKKNSALNSLLRSTESAANGWFGTLARDVQARTNDLSARLEALRAVAAVDEPVLADVDRYLARRSEEPAARSRKVLYPLNELPLQFKSKNEEWQASVALLSALYEVERPVLEAADSANQHREAARQALIQARSLVPDQRGWPPTSQTLEAELREYSESEAQWDALQKSPNRAIWLVSRLSDLAHRYASVAERAQQIGERASGEAVRVRDLEHNINESLQLWRAQLRASSGSPYARDAIQGMLDDALQKMELVRQDYLRGARQYPQVIQEVVLLARRLNSAQVPLDEDQTIDINGEVRVNYPPGQNQ